MYDNNGDIFGFTLNGTEYYYIKNAQNDVIAISNSNGTVIANYYYDSWGKCIETTGDTAIADINPMRYRSYYYDNETGWYHLNTRSYSPEMCRFINADGILGVNQDINEYNLFAYCSNDPINYTDDNGQGKVWNWIKEQAKKVVNFFKSDTVEFVSKGVFSSLDSAFAGDKIKKAKYNYTKDVVNIGTGKKGYTPTPYRDFKGNGTYRNEMSTEKYVQNCKTSYEKMIMFFPDIIKPGDSWEDLVESGKDIELSKTILAWDTSSNRYFDYTHIIEQTENCWEALVF